MIRTIYIEDIENGQVVAEPVRNKFSQVILTKGSELDNSHKEVLKTWNIEKIKILTAGAHEKEDKISPDILEEAVESVKSRYSWEPDNDWEKDMLAAGIECEMQRIMNMGKE